jgi:diacylglycerol kinase family enzyme
MHMWTTPWIVQILQQAVQVLDLGETPPDKALEKIWENLDAQAATNPNAYQVRERLRLIAAGGDGTVAWVLQVLYCPVHGCPLSQIP